MTIALAVPAPTQAELQIAHDGVGCIVAGSFPVIQARLQPPGDVAQARVYFHARGTAGWYYVDMKTGEGHAAFEGTLPQPLASLEAVEYYIEALDRAFTQGRSQEYSARVIAESGLCPAGKRTATALGSVPSSLIIGAPEGAPAIPAGFSNIGLVGGVGGGISTGVLVGIGAAAGVAVAVGVAAGGGGGGDGGAAGGTGTSPGGTPEPTPTPTPVLDISGRWAGSFVENPSAVQCSVTTDLSLDLQQSGTTATGTFQLLIRSTTPAPEDPCPVDVGDVFTGPATATISGSDVTLVLPITNGPEFTFHGTISEIRMSGTSPPDADGPGGSWEVTRQ